MDVSSIATAYTAFSEVLVGFAWGTESPQRCSVQTCRGRSAWLRSLPQNQRRRLLLRPRRPRSQPSRLLPRPVAWPLRSGRPLSSSSGPARCSVLRAAGRAGFLPGAGLSVPRDTGTATHAMMSIMWVYMETWIINDGAAELARGSHLRGVGLRASCLSVGPARTVADGIAELADPRARQEPASHRYELTGMAGPAADVHAGDGPGRRHTGSEFVITAGDQAFVARAAGPASMVAAGSRVTAQCTLSVVADYEWDAFGLPDLRSDWFVHRLKIEHRQIDHVPGAPGRALAGQPGKVLRSFEIERMSRRDDDPDPAIMAWYLLDLAPLRAS